MNTVVKMVNKVSPIKLTATQIIIIVLVVIIFLNKDQIVSSFNKGYDIGFKYGRDKKSFFEIPFKSLFVKEPQQDEENKAIVKGKVVDDKKVDDKKVDDKKVDNKK